MRLLHFVCLSFVHADWSQLLMERGAFHVCAQVRENPKAKYAFSKINEWISSLVEFHCVVKSRTAAVCSVSFTRCARPNAFHITDSRRWTRREIALCELRELRVCTRMSSKKMPHYDILHRLRNQWCLQRHAALSTMRIHTCWLHLDEWGIGRSQHIDGTYN